MRKVLLLGLALALVSGAAYANFCARDYVPAATLLVPYAVVDLTTDPTGATVPDANGYSTLLAVTNVSNTKQLIHVVVWDALSEHVVDFDEVLTGYDVWSINFRDLLNGRFDIFDTQKSPGFWSGTTGTAPQPWGPTTNVPYVNTWGAPQDTDYPTPSNAGCNFPYGNLSGLSGTIIGKLQAAISAWPTQAPCSGNTFNSPPWLAGLTDKPVFFYVTVDVVRACNQNFPDDASYWNGYTGGLKFPIDNNVIIGDIVYLNSAHNFSESIPAVSIEGDLDWAVPGNTGFYSRYQPAGYYDSHEPLPTAFGFRYINAGGVTTNLRVWEGGDSTPYFDFITGDVIACHPYIYYAFDENENSNSRGNGGPSGFNVAEPNVIPYETQSVPMTQANFDGIFATNGWMALIFDPSIGVGLVNADMTIQAWAGVQYTFSGYSTALEAATLGNYYCFPTGAYADVLPALNTYYGAADAYFKK